MYTIFVRPDVFISRFTFFLFLRFMVGGDERCMSRDGSVVLPHGAIGLSAVCDCGIC